MPSPDPGRAARAVDPAISAVRSAAVHLMWANCEDRAARTAALRQGWEDSWFVKARELHPDWPDDKIAQCAANLKAAHFKKMTAASIKARRAKAAAARASRKARRAEQQVTELEGRSDVAS